MEEAQRRLLARHAAALRATALKVRTIKLNGYLYSELRSAMRPADADEQV